MADSEKELLFKFTSEVDSSVGDSIDQITRDLTAIREMTKLTLTMTVDGSVTSAIQTISGQLDELHAKSQISIGGGGGDNTWRTQNRSGGRFAPGRKGRGFSSGGFTGGGSDDDEAGVVHSNEFVIPADVVREVGVGALGGIIASARGGGDLDEVMSAVRGAGSEAIDKLSKTKGGAAAAAAAKGVGSILPKIVSGVAAYGTIEMAGQAVGGATDWLMGENDSLRKPVNVAEQKRLAGLSEADRYAQTDRSGQSTNLAYRNTSEAVDNYLGYVPFGNAIGGVAKGLTAIGSYKPGVTLDSGDDNTYTGVLTQTRLEGNRFLEQEKMNKRGMDRLASEKEYWTESNQKYSRAAAAELSANRAGFGAAQSARRASTSGPDDKIDQVSGLISSQEERITGLRDRGKQIENQQRAENKEALQDANTEQLMEAERQLVALQKEKLSYVKESAAESKKEIEDANKKLDLEERLLEKKLRGLEAQQKANERASERFSELGETDQAAAIWAYKKAQRGDNLNSEEFKQFSIFKDTTQGKELTKAQIEMDMKKGVAGDITALGMFGDTDKEVATATGRLKSIDTEQAENKGKLETIKESLDEQSEKIATSVHEVMVSMAERMAEKMKETETEAMEILNGQKRRQNATSGATGRGAQ